MIYKAEKGDSIYAAAKKAILLAKYKHNVRLIFNDIEISVSGFSYYADICTIYSLRSELKELIDNQ